MTPTILFFQSATMTSKSWRDKLSGVYRFATEVGWQVQMIPMDSSATVIRETIGLYRPIGCIVDRSRSSARPPVAVFQGLPVVLMDQNPRTSGRTYSCVNHDSAATAAFAAQELLKTDLANFTYAPAEPAKPWSLEREKSFAKAIRKTGRTYLRWPNQAQARSPLADLPRPCGILCANDQVAQNVILQANRLGLSVPDDLSVIGIDNDEFICEHTKPSLTSVLPDFENAGYLAAQKLAEVIRNPKARVTVVTYGPREIFRRESTRRLKRTDPRVRRGLACIDARAFDPDLRTDDVAHAMGCTRALADRRFRAATGRSIREEIQARRLEKAFSLLRNPNQAITPIPMLCGYRSEAFFKRLFKRQTGQTMRAWRTAQLEGDFAVRSQLFRQRRDVLDKA